MNYFKYKVYIFIFLLGIFHAAHSVNIENKTLAKKLQSQRSELTTLFSEPNDRKIFKEIIKYINLAASGSKIHMSFYKIDDSKVIAALTLAAKRDVEIHLIVDDSKDNDVIRKQTLAICKGLDSSCIYTCEGSCLGYKYPTTNRGIMHQKFLLFSKLNDGSKNIILQTSSNLYGKSSRRFQDLIIIKNNQKLYNDYFHHFFVMKNEDAKAYIFKQDNKEESIKVYFSPNHNFGKKDDIVINILNKVKCNKNSMIKVGMAYFHSSRKNVAKKLISLSEEGCDIKVITGIKWGSSKYLSPGDKVIEILKDKLIKYETALHSKFIIIDAIIDRKEKKIVLAGTHNLSKTAMHLNDETMLLIENDKVFTDYLNYWHKIKNYRSKASRDRQRKVDLYHIVNALKVQYKNTQHKERKLSNLVTRKYLYTLPVDPINNSIFYYHYKSNKVKFSVCASRMETTEKKYCLVRKWK